VPWANLDDQYAEHPNNWILSDAAFRLHTAAICYANKHKTDGRVVVSKVPTLVPKFKRAALVELLDRGHWIDKGEEYEIRDFLDWNRSRAQIEAESERKSQAGRKGARKRWDQ
jgi:hypothetical protein